MTDTTWEQNTLTVRMASCKHTHLERVYPFAAYDPTYAKVRCTACGASKRIARVRTGPRGFQPGKWIAEADLQPNLARSRTERTFDSFAEAVAWACNPK
jgi:hypothetical protein